jgi:hypothetical protein
MKLHNHPKGIIKRKKIKSHSNLIKFQPQLTSYKTLMYSNQYLIAIVCYKIDVWHYWN